MSYLINVDEIFVKTQFKRLFGIHRTGYRQGVTKRGNIAAD
jgi:hypothetical protein